MENDRPNEYFISVDVETAGPVPSQYSMLAIGACTVAKPRETFYIELKPVNMDFRPEALAVLQSLAGETGRRGRRTCRSPAALRDLGGASHTTGRKTDLRRIQCSLRLDVRQRLLSTLSAQKSIRTCRAGYQIVLHGVDQRSMGRYQHAPCWGTLLESTSPDSPRLAGCHRPGGYFP